MITTLESTSWAKSLSPEKIFIFLFFLYLFDKVPITSSASTPSTIIGGKPKRSNIS